MNLLLIYCLLLKCLAFNYLYGQLVPYNCPPLDPPLYGSVLGQCSTSLGSSCAIRCNPSYESLGPCARFCQANGTWSGSPLLCLNRDITCPPLTLSEGLSLGGPCFNVAGGICQFNCPPGTTLIGSNSIYCTNTGSWSTLPPSCSPNGCSPLRVPENGQLTGPCGVQETLSTISSGSICTFICNPGFELVGSDRLVCLNTGQWNQPPPTCKLSITCPSLTSVANGAMTGSCTVNLIKPLETCIISCNPGYLLAGDSLLTCTLEGTWSSGLPSCIPINCPPFPYSDLNRLMVFCTNPQSSSQILDANLIPGSICRASCPNCYSLVGPIVVSCLIDGRWNDSIGTCMSINCPDIINIANGQTVGTCVRASCKDTCTLTCNPGFILSSSPSNLICQANGQWSQSIPQCIPQPKCQTLIAPNSFSIYRGTCANAMNGDICELLCDPCYTTSGRNRVTCLATGNWDSVLGNCVPITCPALMLSDFLTVQGSCNNARCGDICMFQCESGYQIQGSRSITCGQNGQWNQPAPRCILSRCPDWPVPTGGLFINECPEGLNCPALCPGVPGQRCNLRCGAGYRLIGTIEEVVCSADTLQWSQSLPTCEPIR